MSDRQAGHLRFRHLSLRRKLILVITATSALTLLLAAVIMIVRDVVTFRSNLVAELTTVGEIVGANSTAALLFDDPSTAGEVLAALEAESQILECVLFTSDDKLFARYAREGWREDTRPRAFYRDGHRFDGGQLRVVRAIRLDGDRIGTLAITADLSRLYSRLWRDVATVGLVLFLSVAVALGISTAAQHFVSDPILELASLANKITVDKTYSARAAQRSNDEVGHLTNAMNEMLDEIQLRDGALRAAHDALESNVQDLRKLSAAVEQSPASVMVMDRHGILEYVNKRFEKSTGFTRSEVVGGTPYFLRPSGESDNRYEEMRNAIQTGCPWHGEVQSRRRDGNQFWEQVSITPLVGADGSISNFLAVTEDVTLRRQYETRLLRQATVDALTELPNRLLALDRLEQAVESNLRHGQSVAVMFIDLDGFKVVNDTLGHAAGDGLLRETARRLLGCVRSGDTVARLGGDEFLVIVPEIDGESFAEHLARRIRYRLSEPFEVNGREVFVTASIGIAIAPNDGRDPDLLLRSADAAMYQAKQEGRDSHLFFEREMNEQVVRRMSMESSLRQALNKGELSVHYQPVIDIKEGRIVGGEALLRWASFELGHVPPSDFVPIAEDTGMIVPIGEWVLRTACRDAKAWQEASGCGLSVSVNVSSHQFRNALFVPSVSRALADSGLEPTCLELEVTESLLMEDSVRTSEALAQLHELGVRLAIDDFGTGFCSLSYLKRFPFDILKIDRSFVRDVVTNAEDAALIGAIIAMAEGLNLDVVAEGAETREQLDLLLSKGCRLIQGFYFGKAVSQEAFCRLTVDPPGQIRSQVGNGIRLLSASMSSSVEA